MKQTNNRNSIFILFFFFLFITQNIFAQPVINSFSPAAGAVGTPVAISGSGFSATATDNIVYFGAVRAAVNSATPNLLTVTLPLGSTYKPISVTVNGLTAFSSSPFNVTFTGQETLMGPLSFATGTDLASSNAAGDISVADFDGDSKPDIAVANTGAIDNIKIIRNTGSSGTVVSFDTPIIISAGLSPSKVCTGDVDGDGKIDIVGINNTTLGNILILKNTSTPGNISFATMIEIPLNFASDVFIADLNADGKPELIVLSGANNLMSIYKNTGSPGNLSFDPQVDFSTANYAARIAVGDIDSDGKPDIAVTNSDAAGTFSVFKNTGAVAGAISFANKIDFTTGGQPEGISIGDLDADGKPDVVVANYATASSSISMFRNTTASGTISFTPKQDIPVVYSPSSVSITDLNGDGKPDIAVANYGSQVSVLQNSSSVGSISMLPKVDYTANSGNGYAYLAICDFTGDEKPDIAVTNAFLVSVLRNRLSEPNITSFTPNNGYVGTHVIISGTNFTGTNAVFFGAYNAQSYIVQSPTSIDAVVGEGGSGNVTVINNYGFGTKAGFTYNYPQEVNFCPPPTGSSSLLSSLSGSTYQWQLSTDSVVYTPITNGGYYSAVNTRFLGLNNIPSSFYGYRYRCLVDGSYSTIQTIRFTDTWTGANSTAWEDPANWSCGKVPDSNTSVTINSGTVTINSNITIRNITLAPGVIFTVSPGYTLTITH